MYLFINVFIYVLCIIYVFISWFIYLIIYLIIYYMFIIYIFNYLCHVRRIGGREDSPWKNKNKTNQAIYM